MSQTTHNSNLEQRVYSPSHSQVSHTARCCSLLAALFSHIGMQHVVDTRARFCFLQAYRWYLAASNDQSPHGKQHTHNPRGMSLPVLLLELFHGNERDRRLLCCQASERDVPEETTCFLSAYVSRIVGPLKLVLRAFRRCLVA